MFLNFNCFYFRGCRFLLCEVIVVCCVFFGFGVFCWGFLSDACSRYVFWGFGWVGVLRGGCGRDRGVFFCRVRSRVVDGAVYYDRFFVELYG